jgi:hypothetical protein
MATVMRDTEAIQQALAAGRLTVPDPQTGYHRSMYADCPNGHAASVWRITRMNSPAISEVTMRCSRCGQEFVAPVETLYLR